ncbi:unnamed protein product [Larinioides sclopetarius]|uniref:Uncharacterized protein n=1 Tax=Larinioides sclopetarius TaxID=280406 RepID=A0AAV1ZGW2_9ARAC
MKFSKGHSNQASAAESAGGNKVSIQAGVESHDQGPKKQVKRFVFIVLP